jgi:hypothetical protein
MAKKRQDGGVACAFFPAQRAPASIEARFWIDTIIFVSAVACALAILIAALGAVAAAATGEPESAQQGPSATIQPRTYEGMITDSHCGAKHSAAINKTAADCTQACVRGGEQFVLIDGDTIYLLEGDRVALKLVAGQRVRIVGTLNGKKISVTSIVTA